MIRLTKLSIVFLGLIIPFASAEAQITSGSEPFTEPNGFYSGVKSFEVYDATDPMNPAPGTPGQFTYVYTITNDPGSFLSIPGFTLEVPVGSISSASSLDDGNPATPPPSAIFIDDINGVIRWDWAVATGLIPPGGASEELIAISSYSPGFVNDNIYGIEGEFAFALSDTCVGPFNPPETGEAMACTIGFWKNRSAGKKGLLKFFPDGDFDSVVSAGVVRSSGLFADEEDLLTNLQSKGKRTIQERGKQQLAATLLNLAAGDLFPDNTKCKLFEGNSITINACGNDLSIGDAVNQALVDIVGDTDAQHAAQECSDDINNGIGVID